MESKSTNTDFCIKCGKLLKKNIINKQLYFKCTDCNKNYPTTPTGTLLLEEDYTGIHNTNNISVQNAKDEEINQIIEKKCPFSGCSSNYASIFRTGQEDELKDPALGITIIPEVRTIYTCCICKRQWSMK